MSQSVKRGLALVGVLALTATNAMAEVTMPSPDYATIESAAGVGFGVVLVVGLLMKAKRFFR